MTVLTINGPIGGGAVTIGQAVANELHISFVDRLVFTQAARLVGSPVGTLIDKEQRVVRFRERLGRFVQSMLERSASAGVDGEPYFGPGVETLPPEFYAPGVGDSAGQNVDDRAFIEATTAVVKDLHQKGDVVIIGRGANIILADTPGVIHIGLLAPLEVRAETLRHREHLELEDARVYVEELEQARVTFFRKYFQVHPNDPNLYHMMLNMAHMTPETAAAVIVSTVEAHAL